MAAFARKDSGIAHEELIRLNELFSCFETLKLSGACPISASGGRVYIGVVFNIRQ